MNVVTAVLFDLDDTLFDHAGCARDALMAVQASHRGLAAMPFVALEQAHARLLEELHGEVMLGRVPLEQARIERFRRLLQVAGERQPEDATIAALASSYRDTYRTARRPIRGAAALLAAIRRHARVGIVSNNLAEEQREKLRTCGLDQLVDTLVVSEEAGVSKPDPAIFLLALERLGARPAETVMVGDSWPADVAGARAAGLRAIWFNPSATPAPEGASSVRELRALEPVDAVTRIILDAPRH